MLVMDWIRLRAAFMFLDLLQDIKRYKNFCHLTWVKVLCSLAVTTHIVHSFGTDCLKKKK